MAERHAALEAHHAAVQAFLATARSTVSNGWDQPPSDGKWSVAQVAEHLALTYEAGCDALHGRGTGPTPPRLLRPLLRTLLLRPVLLLGRFPVRSKSPASLQPVAPRADASVGLDRLEATATAFEEQVAALSSDRIDHPAFGRLAVVDFVRFQEIHTRHHLARLS